MVTIIRSNDRVEVDDYQFQCIMVAARAHMMNRIEKYGATELKNLVYVEPDCQLNTNKLSDLLDDWHRVEITHKQAADVQKALKLG